MREPSKRTGNHAGGQIKARQSKSKLKHVMGLKYKRSTNKDRTKRRESNQPKCEPKSIKMPCQSLRGGSYNIDGLYEDRLDTLSLACKQERLDVLCVQETLLRNESNKDIEIEEYKCWREEREGGEKGGGGLCIYIKDGLKHHTWEPDVAPQQKEYKHERQWLLVIGDNAKLAIVNVYMATEYKGSTNHLAWNEEIYAILTKEASVLKMQGFKIVAVGDMNADIGMDKTGCIDPKKIPNGNGKLMLGFADGVDVSIVNTNRKVTKGVFTRQLNGSKSSIDFAMVSREIEENVTSLVIDEAGKYACGSDHSLFVLELSGVATQKIRWHYTDIRRFSINDETNYTDYCDKVSKSLMETDWADFNNMETVEMFEHIRTKMTAAGKEVFGYKEQKKKKPVRLRKEILDEIGKRNALYRELREETNKETPLEQKVVTLEKELDDQKEKVKLLLIDNKLERIGRIRSTLITNDPTKKKFWRFVKNKLVSSGNITAVYDKNGKPVYEQEEIEEAVLWKFTQIFKGQRTVVFKPGETCEHDIIGKNDLKKSWAIDAKDIVINKYEDEICSKISSYEYEGLKNNLQKGKSSGIDGIPNEFIKNGGVALDEHIRAFLNRVVKTSKFPETGNEGKCVIVHKGGDNMDLSNRRPLSVIIGMQHMIAMRHNMKITEVVEREGMLGENQFGFRKGRSTQDALFVLLTIIQKSKLKSNNLTMSFLDIQKA